MPLADNSPGTKYSFENDVSGQLFRWLIESSQVDYQAMIEEAIQGRIDPQCWVQRFAEALKAKIGQSWVSLPQPPAPKSGEGAVARPKAPTYNIWFRPSPSKKIKFQEVARSLLVFTGRIPPPAR